MEIFTIENLRFTYPEQEGMVLDTINLSIKQGDFTIVFGESGSGKTTLLKMLKRELTPHGKVEGTVYYKGSDLTDLDNRTAASEIGYVMQNPETQIVTDKVWHELAFGLENLGMDSDTIRRRVGEIANFFGIHSWFRKKTTELSGGQKQLLNLASIMVMQPEVLILDEPTSQLDPIAAMNFIQTLEKINRDLGLTIIIVEHRLEEVMPLADKVILLEDGKVLLTGAAKEVGEQLRRVQENHPMLLALPTAAKVYYGLNYRGEGPLTVREGRQFITENLPVQLDRVEQSEETEEVTGSIAIELKNIWFRYEKDLPDIVAGANVKIRQGEIISILGGNGSGKTTLLNIMAGQLHPYRGTVLLDGKKLQKYKGKELYKRNIAVLPQDPKTVFLKSTVYEDYEEIAKAVDYTKEELKKRVDEVITKLDITHLLEKNPFDLSGGEQQKVALGKVLLLQPKILFLDEPTKGIDAFSKQNLLRMIKELQSQGLTIIIVTHDIEFAALVSDRTGLFFDCDLISIDTPVEFFSSNNYYTTAASRMARHLFPNAITYYDVIMACNKLKENHLYEKAID